MQCRAGLSRRRSAEFTGHAVDIAPEDGREIGVDNGGVAAANQLGQRRDLTADRNLGEACALAGIFDNDLVDGILPGMHQHYGDGIDTIGAGPGKFGFQGFEVNAAHRLAVGHGALIDFDHALVELFGQNDFLGENIRPGLIGDPQCVAEAPGNDQQGAVALALEQRIGGDRGAHLDVADARGRDRCGLVDAEQIANALDGGIGIGFRIFRQQLALMQRAIGRAADHICKGAATVDPEIPNACHDHHPSGQNLCLGFAMDTGHPLRIIIIVGITSIICR